MYPRADQKLVLGTARSRYGWSSCLCGPIVDLSKIVHIFHHGLDLCLGWVNRHYLNVTSQIHAGKTNLIGIRSPSQMYVRLAL